MLQFAHVEISGDIVIAVWGSNNCNWDKGNQASGSAHAIRGMDFSWAWFTDGYSRNRSFSSTAQGFPFEHTGSAGLSVASLLLCFVL